MINRKIVYSAITLSFFALTAKAQVFYRADRISINTSFSEMAPVLYNDGLIFSSNRKSDVVVVTVDQSGNFLYNMYFSKIKGNKSFSAPDLFAKELSDRYNQSSASISSDGKTLYYTATRNAIGAVGDNILGDTLKNGILISTYGTNGWLPPEEFTFNSDDFNVGYPCISVDGKRLYFASENPSGFGGYDLYYSDFINNSWKEPVNLGSVVNSNENEVFPFIFHENRLYFASRGHAGEGGTDIFYSDYIQNEWTTPVNMPKPFNSKFDDFAFVSNAEMDTGYFASNRKGTDDIYMFVSTFPSFTECPAQVKEDFCYEFYESGTLSLDTTTLRYEWDLGDGTKIRDIRVQHCYAEPGNYMVQLNVIDTLTGEVSFSQASYDLMIERIEQPFITAPDTIYTNENILFDATKSNIKKFTIENYYWDFGDGSVLNQPLPKHRFAKEGDYIVRLGLTGSNQNNPDDTQKACASKHIVAIIR
jgi:PKD repeat protein